MLSLYAECHSSISHQKRKYTTESRNNLGMRLELHKLQFLLICMMNLQNKRKQQMLIFLHPKCIDTP